MHDILAEQGLHPAVLGGLSLGAMTASSLAGAVGRRELITMLAHGASAPGPAAEAPGQGMALAFAPDGTDVAALAAHRPGVHLSGDFGPTADGSARILMLSGERTALEAMAAELPPGLITPLPDRPIAVHSPLRADFRAFMAPTSTRWPSGSPSCRSPPAWSPGPSPPPRTSGTSSTATPPIRSA
ncbi:hypothetical protein [Kitasatospora camelliae]|uniref:Uncharacterized protein n=1 Tax=Kitasatospora camelliae TaxID=3156397 RepID=A0AAU8K822_9ACTN